MKILDRINSPEDVKRLTEQELVELAGEIRQKITKTAAKNGGHLASNLGMVDAEIALHRVFSHPDDRIIFDVGHQAYAHKLITGRKDIFDSLRKSGGMSGFTSRAESEYDVFTAGHSGTSLSAAIGMAEANRLAGRDGWTVAVVGDGSFTNGMVYEALNQLEDKKLKLILLLNDNAMSISRNVGGVSHYFAAIRTSRKYFSFKMRTKKIFSAIPLVGGHLVKAASAAKDFIKRTLGAQTWFEAMGLEYIGPVNGNDIHKLTAVLEEAKHFSKPIVVHMTTKKGLGYAPAEDHPEKFHSAAPFDFESGTPLDEKPRTFTDEFSDVICERAAEDKGIVAVTAAMTDGCGLSLFRGIFPERFFDVGIAEEHAVTFASGLAVGGGDDGIKPVVVMYSTFSQRVFDQLWHDFCLQYREKSDIGLTLVLSHAGFVPGDGVTHQGLYDVALLSRLPDVEIYSPDTFCELRRALDTALSSKGLTVVRYPKSSENVYDVTFEDHLTWKETVFDGEGNDTVVTYGRISKNAVEAARAYSEETGRRVTVAVLERIRPLPADERFSDLLREADKVSFVEEGIRSGGIGEAVAASGLARTPVRIVALDDGFIRAGTVDDIEKRTGFDVDSLKKAMKYAGKTFD